jgi:hypothetical protein
MKIQCRAAFWAVLAISLAACGRSPMLSAQAGDGAAAPASRAALPEAPVPTASPIEKRAADWQYVTVTGSLFGATIANAEALERCDNCTFLEPALHRRGFTYGVGLSVDVGISYLTYRWKKKGYRWWYVPAIVLTAGNAYLSYHWAASTDSPSSTTPVSSTYLPFDNSARIRSSTTSLTAR